MDFLACASGSANPISAASPPRAELISGLLGLPVVLIDTRQRRSTATILASTREWFRARDPAMLAYVREITALTAELAAVLRQARPDYRQAGTLVSAAHGMLRDLVACATPLLDQCAARVILWGARSPHAL